MERPPEEAEFYRRARDLAEHEARIVHLTGDVAEDCVQSFVVKWLFKHFDPPVWTWSPARRDVFLRQAARNHTLNFIRDRRSMGTIFDEYPELAVVEADFEGREPNVDANLLRDQFWEQIRSGLSTMTVRQRTLLMRYYQEEAAVAEIASECSCSAHAVEVGLCAARRRLRLNLVRQGDTESELRSYLIRDFGISHDGGC